MPNEPVSPEDATLLCATGGDNQLQIGAVCFFEGAPLRDGKGELRIDDLRTHVESRLLLSPRYRQRIAPIAFDAARPVWVDDHAFDIENHVRVGTLPDPGGHEGLRLFLGDLLSQPLDVDHPLWDTWVIDGLDDDQVAVVLRVHHVMADGISLLDAALLMLGTEPQARPDEPTGVWSPTEDPGPARLLWDAVYARRRHQMDLALSAGRFVLDPRNIIRTARSAVSAITTPPSTAPALPLSGRVGHRRDFLWTSLSMPDLLAVKRAHGVTLNDVVLAVVTDAVRRQLGAEQAEALEDHPPRVLVPVGGADQSADGAGNAFSFMVAGLPVAVRDPIERLRRIHDEMEQRKASLQSSAALSLFSIVDLVPLPLLRRLIPEALTRQPFVNLAVTNVPGVREDLYLLDSRMQDAHPIVTGVGNLACIIGVLSYRDRLGVGITVDPDVVDDADSLLEAIGTSAADLAAV
jgi:WS/DGAT/MGAT family acyltransferase